MTLIKFKNPVSKSMNYDPFFGGMFDVLFNDSYAKNQSPKSTPLVNVKETTKGFEIEIAIPGLEKNDVKLQLKDQVLTISAEKESKEEVENEMFIKREFNYNTFKRAFTLPEIADSESVKAVFTNGILTIMIGKIETVKPEVKEILIS